MTISITNEKFWYVIELIDWRHYHSNYEGNSDKFFERACEIIKKQLRSREIRQMFKEKYYTLVLYMKNKIKDYDEMHTVTLREHIDNILPDLNLSDDDIWTDYLNHIIGMGKIVYEEVMEDPSNLIKYWNFSDNYSRILTGIWSEEIDTD